jgi:hypothetical protein
MDREEAIAAMEEAPPWTTFELLDPRVIQLIEDGVVVAPSSPARTVLGGDQQFVVRVVADG